MTKRLPLWLFLLLSTGITEASSSRPLTDWAALDANGAIRIVNRLDYTKDNFAAGTPGRNDDQAVIDFMDDNSGKTFINPQGKSGAPIEFNGPFRFAKENVQFDFHGSVTVKSPQVLDYAVTLSAPEPKEILTSFFSIRLNRAMLDRPLDLTLQAPGGIPYHTTVNIPANRQGGWIWSSPKGQPVLSVAIPMMHGTLRLSGFSHQVMICKYGTSTGNLRIYLESGKLKSISRNLKIEFIPYTSITLNLAKAANMGLADDNADDRRGGWTDQGPDNDLRRLPVGRRHFGNVEFNVIDPARNDGKAVLAFANPSRSYFLKQADVEVGNARFDYLYLLNAAAWCQGGKVGEIKVAYSDGTSQTFEVEDRRDVANWWNPESFSRTTVVWKEQNQCSLIGLYLSRYQVKNKPIDRITFMTANRAVWLIVAAAGVIGQPPFPQGSDQEVPYKIEAGKDWKSFTFSKNIVPGSPLDFSGFLDAPAGKYGRLTVRNGRFVFADRPEQPVRFLGLSTCEDINYLEHAETDIMVDRIARRGYNAVRLHHFDEALIKRGATTIEFDPERLDKLFYFIARLKQRGIYITLDLFTMRTSGFAQKYKNMFDVKSSMMFSAELRNNLKEFARRLLCTVNPHTGLALKDDPALITIGLINEDPMFTLHNEYKYPNPDPIRNAMIKPVFEAWCKEKGIDSSRPNPQIMVRFAIDRHIAVYDELKSYLLGLGVTTPMSDISCSSQFAEAVPRSRFDYVDNHFYVDHPTFPKEFFKMPFANENVSSIKGMCRPLMRVASSRIAGKPFMVTEFNFCAPNMYRGEGGPIMGAMAALQNWDGIFRFGAGYSRSYRKIFGPLDDGGHLGSFAVMNDPIQGLSELMIALLYQRGDVKPAADMSILTVPTDVWKNPATSAYREWGTREKADIPECFGELGFYQQIGMLVSDRPAQPGEFSIAEVLNAEKLKFTARPPGVFEPAKGKITSSTGEISIDSNTGTFKVVTPKSEALVVPGRALTGKRLKVSRNTTFATVFAGALDSLPLEQSKKILVLHLTDVKATGQKFGVFRDQLRMYNWGNFSPYLVRRGSAEITLDLGPGNYTVDAIGLDGKGLGSVSIKPDRRNLTFTASTDLGEVPPMVYLITRR